MSSVFISYKRENLLIVQRMVAGLRDAGLTVWWDQDIAPDAQWEATIERELNTAKIAIVMWSQASVRSENVKAEARRARSQGKLIQVFVEPCEPPLFFGERQGVDLTSWDGEVNDNRFQSVLAAAHAIIAGKRPPEGVGYTARKRAPWALLTTLFVFLSAVLGFVSNLGGARDGICKLPAIHQACLNAGLIAPEGPTGEEQQSRLIEGLNGAWGRLDRDCTVTVTYRVDRDRSGIYRIHGTATNFESVMQVVAIDPTAGAITARATAANATGVRELWEYRPNGDVLALRDQAGTETTLARCAPAE